MRALFMADMEVVSDIVVWEQVNVPAKLTPIFFTVGKPENLNDFKGRPGLTLTKPYSVVSKGEDWMTAWNQVWHW